MISKIRNILLWILVIGYFPVLSAFVSNSRKQVVCSDVRVVVNDSIEAGFVNSKQIHKLVLKKYPQILGNRIESVNCEEIEQFIKKHEAINSCEAYYTIAGRLHIELNQRKPLCRVFSGHTSYYIDGEGEKMSLFNSYAAHVLIISGHVDKLDSFNEVLELARYISASEFWNAQIEQLYVERNGELTLAPRVGDQIIHFGSTDNSVRKMEKLYALYTTGLHPREWNNYSEINLKFEGQIICTKK